MHSSLSIESERFTAGIAPALGGSLAWFGARADPLSEFVRATPARALYDGYARLASSYPLVPYSNRVADGRFVFDGVATTLRRNTDVSEYPIHGVGFQREWTVTAQSPRSLTIALSHAGRDGTDPDWPWSFAASQSFTLDDDALVIAIALTNRDHRRMPAGIGLHPFFPKTPATRLRFAADGVWTNDRRKLPESRGAVPPAFDFAGMRAIGALDVDNCFAGWGRTAVIEWPERKWGMTIEASDAFGHLVVFTGPGREAIAVEPVSHVNNALNLATVRDDTGLVGLGPGETLEGTVRFAPFALGG